MACIAHDELSQVLNGLQVSDSVDSDFVDVSLSGVVFGLAWPSGHVGEHVQDSRVVADDVHIAVVDQNLMNKLLF